MFNIFAEIEGSELLPPKAKIMSKTIEQKIQQLKLDTVKVVTEMRL